MINRLKTLFKSEFVRNVATLATGTTIAQAIPVAISPILTRLYTPEDFGVLALFMAMTAICGAIANAKYEMAIMLPKKQEDALNILYLSAIIALGFSAFLLLIVILFKGQIAVLLNEPKIENWLFFVPFSVLFIGLFNALNLYNTREKNFKDIAVSAISKSTGLAVTQLGLGVIKMGALGLVAGQIMSYLAGNFILLRRITASYSIKGTFDKKNIKTLAKRYKRFPQYTMPGNLMNALSLNLVSFLISGIYSTTTLGFYALARRMLSAPSMVIGKSISQVYFQKMSATKNAGGDTVKVFIQTLKRLVILSLPIFVIAYFLAEPVFVFVFGEDWRVAGQYAKIIIPLAGVRFVSSALSPSLHIYQRQDITLKIQLLQLFTLIILFILIVRLKLVILSALKIYSFIYSLEYIIFTYIYIYIIKKK